MCPNPLWPMFQPWISRLALNCAGGELGRNAPTPDLLIWFPFLSAQQAANARVWRRVAPLKAAQGRSIDKSPS